MNIIRFLSQVSYYRNCYFLSAKVYMCAYPQGNKLHLHDIDLTYVTSLTTFATFQNVMKHPIHMNGLTIEACHDNNQPT